MNLWKVWLVTATQTPQAYAEMAHMKKASSIRYQQENLFKTDQKPGEE